MCLQYAAERKSARSCMRACSVTTRLFCLDKEAFSPTAERLAFIENPAAFLLGAGACSWLLLAAGRPEKVWESLEQAHGWLFIPLNLLTYKQSKKRCMSVPFPSQQRCYFRVNPLSVFEDG